MKNSNRRVRDTLIRSIGAVGLHVTDRTATSDVRELVRLLRPVRGKHALIRLGPDGDGGYLVPDDLEGMEYAFSPGVATESGFEAALAHRGFKVFLADRSVDGPAEPLPGFVFRKMHIGCTSDDSFMTLEEWKTAELGPYSGDLLLQMDIEGAEYETLLSAPASLLRQFRIMVIEFHFLHELFNRRFFDLASRVFHKLLQTHAVVHIHPNNCCGSVKADGVEVPRIAEFTLHRTDRIGERTFCRQFPHPLDRKNTRKADLVLAPCWYAE